MELRDLRAMEVGNRAAPVGLDRGKGRWDASNNVAVSECLAVFLGMCDRLASFWISLEGRKADRSAVVEESDGLATRDVISGVESCYSGA